MKATSDITACVIDHGLFFHLADRLSREYAKVYYWTPWERTMPKMEEGLVGDGFAKVQRIPDFWEVKDDCDLFVFPDVGFGGEQMELITQYIPVWGHHGADVIENNRGLFLKLLEGHGMAVPKYMQVVGFKALMEHLRGREDVYIKVSRFRGNWETFHWRNEEEDRDEVCWRGLKMGPGRERVTFYVLDAIKAAIEDGIDTYSISGAFPKVCLHGLEKKDKSYLCRWEEMSAIAPVVAGVNEAMKPILREYDHCGAFSTEVRVDEHGTGYFIDPTMRFPSPGSQCMAEMYGNLGGIIAAGAKGELIEPEPIAKYGVQALIAIDPDRRQPGQWTTLKIPEEIRQWCKFPYACQLDDSVVLPPHDLGRMLGWLVATGDSAEVAISTLKSYRKLLPDGLECEVESIGSLVIEAEKAAEKGIDLGAMPEPGAVLEEA